jgi:DNA topoisomerase-1
LSTPSHGFINARKDPAPGKRSKVLTSEESAAEAGLAYVTGEEPGIKRQPQGRSFRYVDVHGRAIRDQAVLRRIAKLVIPPNWTQVWICAKANGHLQATGRDARDRKQYRYHAKYRAAREETKYHRMTLFGKLLPQIRQKVDADLALPGLPKEKVLAAVIRLMDLVHIRVGNEEYARDNQSFGLTTMRDRHVEVEGSRIHFQFKGKSGKLQDFDLLDRRLARIVQSCQDVPGYELFQYVNEGGSHTAVGSGTVNQYLHDITGEDITAKDFRTWHGTVHAAEHLCSCAECASEAEAKKNVVAAIKAVAERLGNRPATCRKYYVHPIVVNLYISGELAKHMDVRSDDASGLGSSERSVLKILSTVETN